ncbi:MAG TPA: hypothetical protein VFZ03_17705 [Dongiaceae bacterium]
MPDFYLSVMAGRRPGHPIQLQSDTSRLGSPGLAASLRPGDDGKESNARGRRNKIASILRAGQPRAKHEDDEVNERR